MKDFKQFALYTWRDKTNEQYFLSLQDNHNINVVFAIWCAWKSYNNQKLTISDCDKCYDLCKKYEKQHILTLRKIRKSLKGKDGYNNALDNEIKQEFELIEILNSTKNEVGDINTKSYFKQKTGIELNLQ